MAIDMEQFKGTFIEESLEGLQGMESALLSLDTGAADPDLINTIFRAAHSIKGGSATFGFADIAGFTHVAETLLDQVRGGERAVTQEIVDVLLSSVDCLREMLATARDGGVADKTRVTALKEHLERILHGASTVAATVVAPVQAVDSPAALGWHIVFRPMPHMLTTGNDVVLMFRELAALGELEVQVDTSSLPAVNGMEPEKCYLAWDVKLLGDITRQQVSEVFEWAEGDCELDISPLTEVAVRQMPEAVPRTLPSVPTAANVRAAPIEDVATGVPDKRKAALAAESSSIRVGIDKVDAIINMVGELVITQSMLSQLGEDFDMGRLERLQDGLAQLERNTRELQESVMRIRMLPISFAFNRFPRMVRDMCQKLGKQIELRMSGEQTELDKTVMEKIGDPLVHLVRNSMDHGIEMPEARRAAGKPDVGVVHLNAYHQGGNIVIEITDDGAGINKDRVVKKAIERGLIGESEALTDERIYDLLFQPGFSTADVVSDVSGRGVGMDVVKRNINALGGRVEVKSEQGRGSTFTIRLPLTLAILDGQLIRVGEQTYIIPLVSIIESLQVNKKLVSAIAGKAELYKLRDEYIQVIRFYEAFNVKPDSTELANGLLVVVEGAGQKAGLMVDDLLGQQQVVIKSLETNFKRVEGLSGATILGDGTVALIIDVAGLISLMQSRPKMGGVSVMTSNSAAA